jgi:hypothetical protein
MLQSDTGWYWQNLQILTVDLRARKHEGKQVYCHTGGTWCVLLPGA